MPEQLTKHPEITMEVLRSAGARCGEGAPQEILIACPRERFCRLPGGELCVYGLPDASRMTQISRADWALLAQGSPAASPPAARPVLGDPLLVGGSALLLGMVIGLATSRFVRKRP